MSALIEKIRKARQSVVKVGAWSFTITRPTDMDMLDLRQRDDAVTLTEIFRRFVIGWEGVCEIDLLPGGSPTPVAFSSDVFIEWIADKSDLWGVLNTAIVESYRAHEAALESAAKN